MRCGAVRRLFGQSRAELSTAQHSAIILHFFEVQCSAVQDSAVQCRTVQESQDRRVEKCWRRAGGRRETRAEYSTSAQHSTLHTLHEWSTSSCSTCNPKRNRWLGSKLHIRRRSLLREAITAAAVARARALRVQPLPLTLQLLPLVLVLVLVAAAAAAEHSSGRRSRRVIKRSNAL